MTREEKEQTGKYLLEMARLLEGGCWQQKMLLNAVHIIDEVLEKKPILDKISAEIEDLYSYADFDWDTKTCYNMVRLEEVQRVIDKYRGDSEGEK